MIDIELIEAAIVNNLKTISELRMVSSHQGEIDGIRNGTMLVNMPAALVEYTGAEVAGERAGESVRCKVNVDFTIFAVGKNLKGPAEASADVRAILKKIREKLNGYIYDGKIMLIWQSEGLLFITPASICVYQQNYRYVDYLKQ